jgi:hypothetical protein
VKRRPPALSAPSGVAAEPVADSVRQHVRRPTKPLLAPARYASELRRWVRAQRYAINRAAAFDFLAWKDSTPEGRRWSAYYQWMRALWNNRAHRYLPFGAAAQFGALRRAVHRLRGGLLEGDTLKIDLAAEQCKTAWLELVIAAAKPLGGANLKQAHTKRLIRRIEIEQAAARHKRQGLSRAQAEHSEALAAATGDDLSDRTLAEILDKVYGPRRRGRRPKAQNPRVRTR